METDTQSYMEIQDLAQYRVLGRSPIILLVYKIKARFFRLALFQAYFSPPFQAYLLRMLHCHLSPAYIPSLPPILSFLNFKFLL